MAGQSGPGRVGVEPRGHWQSESGPSPTESESGQIRFITRPKSRAIRAKRKINVLELTERGAEMGNELESDRAMGG